MTWIIWGDDGRLSAGLDESQARIELTRLELSARGDCYARTELGDGIIETSDAAITYHERITDL